MSNYNHTTTNTGTGCFRCCFSFILTLGLTSLFMWLSLRTSNPVLSIQDIYIPTLNKTLTNSPTITTNISSSIYIDIKLDNENKDKGIYYDQLNITLRYFTNDSKTNDKLSIPISNYTISGFHQGHNKHTRRKSWVETNGTVLDNDGNGFVVFRVDLSTKVRFKILFWKTKRHRLVVGADFVVNDKGKKERHKGTRLKSGVPEFISGKCLILVVFSLFVLVVN